MYQQWKRGRWQFFGGYVGNDGSGWTRRQRKRGRLQPLYGVGCGGRIAGGSMLLQQPCGGRSCSESRGMYVPLALWLCLLPAKVVVAVIMVEKA